MRTIRVIAHKNLKGMSSDLLILILDKDHSQQVPPQVGEHNTIVTPKFDDIEDPDNEWGTPLTTPVANRILDAATQTTGDIIVSCHGGKSRSTATALALEELNIARIQGTHPLDDSCCPNRLVFDTIIDAAMRRGLKPRHTATETDCMFEENQRRFTERTQRETQ